MALATTFPTTKSRRGEPFRCVLPMIPRFPSMPNSKVVVPMTRIGMVWFRPISSRVRLSRPLSFGEIGTEVNHDAGRALTVDVLPQEGPPDVPGVEGGVAHPDVVVQPGEGGRARRGRRVNERV